MWVLNGFVSILLFVICVLALLYYINKDMPIYSLVLLSSLAIAFFIPPLKVFENSIIISYCYIFFEFFSLFFIVYRLLKKQNIKIYSYWMNYLGVILSIVFLFLSIFFEKEKSIGIIQILNYISLLTIFPMYISSIFFVVILNRLNEKYTKSSVSIICLFISIFLSLSEMFYIFEYIENWWIFLVFIFVNYGLFIYRILHPKQKHIWPIFVGKVLLNYGVIMISVLMH